MIFVTIGQLMEYGLLEFCLMMGCQRRLAVRLVQEELHPLPGGWKSTL
jgi:hypothetical protein